MRGAATDPALDPLKPAAGLKDFRRSCFRLCVAAHCPCRLPIMRGQYGRVGIASNCRGNRTRLRLRQVYPTPCGKLRAFPGNRPPALPIMRRGTVDYRICVMKPTRALPIMRNKYSAFPMLGRNRQNLRRSRRDRETFFGHLHRQFREDLLDLFDLEREVALEVVGPAIPRAPLLAQGLP